MIGNLIYYRVSKKGNLGLDYKTRAERMSLNNCKECRRLYTEFGFQ